MTTIPRSAPTTTTDPWAQSAAWLHDASATLERAAADVEAGDVDRALKRIDAAVTTAESVREQLHTRRRCHSVAGVMAEVLREHLQQEQR